MVKKLKGALIATAVLAVLAAGGTAIAGATGGGGDGANDGNGTRDDGNGTPIIGNSLAKAKAVALKQTGGGQVTGSELRDEEGYYEVEVTKSDGSQVDVHLDRNFNLLDAQGDGTGSASGN